MCIESNILHEMILAIVNVTGHHMTEALSRMEEGTPHTFLTMYGLEDLSSFSTSPDKSLLIPSEQILQVEEGREGGVRDVRALVH